VIVKADLAKKNNEEDTTDQGFEMLFFGHMRLGDNTNQLAENLCDISLLGRD
jgi:hypothetical protein